MPDAPPCDILSARIAGQRLVDPVSGPDAMRRVVHDLVGVQAQLPASAALALRCRTRGTTAAELGAALWSDGAIVRTWWVRGTIHLVARDDLVLLARLLAPAIVARGARRARELGLDDATIVRGVAVIEQTVADLGGAGREELSAALRRRRIDPAGQRIALLLHRAGVLGKIGFGPERSGRPTYRPLVAPADVDADPRTLSVSLVRRYLGAYGPATAQDFVSWSGLDAPQAAAAFGALGEEIVPLGTRWLLASDRSRLAPPGRRAPPVHLLPGFDPYVLGYRSRDLLVEAPMAKRINAGGGMVRATLCVGGRLAGTWTMQRRSTRLEIEVSPFGPLDARVRAAIEREAVDVGRFLGTAATLVVGRPSSRRLATS